ncbi:MAG: hypothetical protein V4722_15530 [Bacteroidota bacterium]
MKRRFFISLISLLSLWLVACTKGGDLASPDGSTYSISSQLSSKKVFPALATDTSNGVLTGWYDEGLNDMSFRFAYVKDTTSIKLDTLKIIRFFKGAGAAIDTATAARRFFINTAISAGSKTNLTGAFSFGVSGNTGLLPDEQASFLAGTWYMVLYSAKFPNGVLGGQLAVTKNQ